MVLNSWNGGLAFEGWTLQVGCLVFVVSIGTFRSSDATLKSTAPDFGVCCTSHFRKVGFKHAMFKSSVGAALLLLAKGGIRFLGITSVDVKESSFSNFHVLEKPGSVNWVLNDVRWCQSLR